MKSVLKNIAVFVVMVFAFSLLSGCPGSSAGNVASNAPGGGGGGDKKSNYPPAPQAIMTSNISLLDGTSFKLQDKKGKVVLVNLWATWCGPCIQEMPHIVELQEKFRDQGFEVYGLNTDDEPKDKIEAFGKDHKLNYTLGWSDAALMTEMVRLSGLQGIPQSILIDREGHLTGVFTGGGAGTVNKLKETVPKILAQ